MEVLIEEKTKSQNSSKNSFGQVVVEYVLLLVVGVIIATTITSAIVKRSSDNPGFLIKKWKEIIDFIGEDYPDE